jgi:hypothetical protein
MATHKAYLALFVTTNDAISFEESCLSIGRDLLPPYALDCLDGRPPTADYWKWLIAEYHASGREPEPAHVTPDDIVVELDQRVCDDLHEAIAAFSRAASCFGGYAPRLLGELAKTEPMSTADDEADYVLALVKAANEGAWVLHKETGGGVNPPGQLEVHDTRETGGPEGHFVRIVWGTGRSIVTLEQFLDDCWGISDWWVSVGYQELGGQGLAVVSRGGALTRRSLVLSLAERVHARDLDLVKTGGEGQ